MSEQVARRIVHEREGGRCGICRRPATNWCHRTAKGQGGLWLPSNGILLCGSGTTGCHGWCHHNPVAANAGGWIVQTGEVPSTVPVWLNPRTLYPGWWLLDDDGMFGYTDRHDTPLLPEWAYAQLGASRLGTATLPR
jgi:hypothetical protein